MNESEWDIMRANEDSLWWYRALHDFLLKILSWRNISNDVTVLDVGCGTGGLMQKLADKGFRVIGFDFSLPAIHHTKKRGLDEAFVAEANAFPFKDSCLDLVTCIDVMGSEFVSPSAVVAETFRVLKPGGFGLFQMAAHQWLFSEHDRAVHQVRRLNKSQFTLLFENAKFHVIYVTYLFFSLFPLMATWKLLRPPRKNLPRNLVVSDVKPINPQVNETLYAICTLERFFLGRISLPVGTSVCALVKKA